MARGMKAASTPRRKGKAAVAAPESPARGFGSTAVYESLRRDILHLALAPGTLLDESEIAERFNLSRSPVREALIRLSAEGLVVTLRNRSSIVAPFDIATVPSYVDAASLMYRLTARLAALNRTAAQMARIEELQRSHLAASESGNLEALVSLNRDFHTAIAEASGNSFFAQWTRSLLDQGQRILAIYLHDFDNHIPDGTLDQHLALVDAIRRRDPDAAEVAGARDADILAQQLSHRLHMRRVGDFPLQAPAPPAPAAAPPRARRR
jgi:DNA-binding GntR family transcriptional regulator